MEISNLFQQWLPSKLLIIFLPVFSILVLFKLRKRTGLPPGPRGLPIIGNLHQLGSLPHYTLRKWSSKYGPVMLVKLGSVPTVFVSSPETAREVMKTHDIVTCSRPPSPGPRMLSYDYLDVAFSPYSDYWREMRKIFVQELLTTRRVQSFAYAREAAVNKLVAELTEAGPTPVNLDEKVFGLSDGIIGTVAFGNMYGTNQFNMDEFQHVLHESINMLAGFSAEDCFPTVGKAVDVLVGTAARRVKTFKALDKHFQWVVDQHLDPARPKPETEDLVDVLLGVMKEKQGSGSINFTVDNVKAVLMDTFIGGIDTSSVTLGWALAELMKNPRILKKAQAEIRAIVGKKPKVDQDDIPKLAYLKLIVKEILRLHPTTPLLFRESMGKCEIAGYQIPAGARLCVSVFAVGRDPKSWENPDSFIPERFEKIGTDYRGNHFEYIPFGSGRRVCPGMSMGVATVEYTLANLLFCFDWGLPNEMRPEDISMEEVGGLTFHRKIPLTVVPTRYNWQN